MKKEPTVRQMPAQDKFWENKVIDANEPKVDMSQVMERLDAIEAKIDKLLGEKEEQDAGWTYNK